MNDRMDHAASLLEEHVQNDELIESYDARIAVLQARVAELEAESRAIELRNDAIADELAPALKRAGPVEWWCGGTKRVVRLTVDGSLSIEPIRPTHALADAMGPEPRMYSDATLTEAALYAVFSDDDDDDLTETIEVVSLPGRRAVLAGNDAG